METNLINSYNLSLTIKKHSVVDVSQITTISKARIVNPIRPTDSLHGVLLDRKNLNEINEKMKKLFIFDK